MKDDSGFMCMYCNEKSEYPVALQCGHLLCQECASLADDFTHVCPLCRSVFAPASFVPTNEACDSQNSARSMALKDLWQQYLKTLNERISSPAQVIIASQPSYSVILTKKVRTVNGKRQTQPSPTRPAWSYDIFTYLCGQPLLIDAPQFGCLADGLIFSGNDRWSSVLQDGGSVIVDLDSQRQAPQAHIYLPFYHAASAINGLERSVTAVNASLGGRVSALNLRKYVLSFAGRILMRSFSCMDPALFRDRELVTSDNFQALRSVVARENPRRSGVLIYKAGGCCHVCFRDRKIGVYKIGLDGQHELQYAYCAYEDCLRRDYRGFAVPVLHYAGQSLLPVQIAYTESVQISKCYDKQLGLIRGAGAEDQFLLVADHEALQARFQASVRCIRVKCDIGCYVFALHDDLVTSDYVKSGAIVAASHNYAGYAARYLGRLVGVVRDFALVKWNTADGTYCELVNVATPFASELVYL